MFFSVMLSDASNVVVLVNIFDRPRCPESLLKLLQTQIKYYGEHQDEAEALLKVGYSVQHHGVNSPVMAAWTNVMRVLLNLHEVVTRY